MTEVRSCYRCGLETTEEVAQCPKCGQRLRTAREVRRLGWVQVVLGLIIVGMMGTISAFVVPLMLKPGAADAGGARFNGTAQQALMILGLFGVVLLFGLVGMLNGIWQIKYGRRNRWLFVVVMALALMLVVVTWVVRSALRS